MNAVTLYAYTAAGLAVFLLLHPYIYRGLSIVLNERLVRMCLKGSIQPYLLRRRRLFGPLTYRTAFWCVVHWGTTLVCNIISVQDRREASSRAGTIALLHFVPLFFSRQFSMAADLFGISLKAYRLLHRALGVMAVLQSASHVVISLWDTVFDLTDKALRYGFVGAITLAVLFVIALPWIRSWSYGLLVQCHTLLSLVAVAMAALHLWPPQGIHAISILLTVTLTGCTTILHLLQVVFRNKFGNRSFPVGEIVKHRGAITLTFSPARPWELSAGQYVYLKVPGLGFWSIWQSHPFYPIWWEDGPEGNSITVLAKVQSGFTRALYLVPHRWLRVIVDGPYGSPTLDNREEMRSYDAITLFATDIGIAGQLPYVRELLHTFIEEERSMTERGGGTRRHRISLIWEVKEEYYQDWICDWMDRLLAEDDETLILHYSLYVINRADRGGGSAGHQDHLARELKGKPLGTRGAVFYGSVNVEEIMAREMHEWTEKMLVTVSANPAVRDEVRSIVLRERPRLGFQELEFQPDMDTGSYWAPDMAAV